MTEAAVPDDDQRRLLQFIYDHFRRTGSWPTFDEIDRPLRRSGLDAMKVLLSVPAEFGLLARPGRAQPAPGDIMRLSIWGIQQCDGGAEDVACFIRLLPWLAEKELRFDPVPASGDRTAKVTSAEVAEFLKLPPSSTVELKRIYEILSHERYGWAGGGIMSDGEWHINLTREIARFADVRNLADYQAALNRWDAENRASGFGGYARTSPSRRPALLDTARLTDSADHEDSCQPEPDTYVSALIIGAIEANTAQSRWNCDKLLQLIIELNENFDSKNAYASHALLRAILDHIPPIMGFSTFAEVANNYSWGRTDRGYIKKLADFRLQGDDALHRPISPDLDILRFEDLPPPIWINRLLQECARKL